MNPCEERQIDTKSAAQRDQYGIKHRNFSQEQAPFLEQYKRQILPLGKADFDCKRGKDLSEYDRRLLPQLSFRPTVYAMNYLQ